MTPSDENKRKTKSKDIPVIGKTLLAMINHQEYCCICISRITKSKSEKGRREDNGRKKVKQADVM